MKKTSHRTPTRSKLSIFRQLCNLIPAHPVSQLARDTGAQEKSRSFTPWSHVVSLLFAQFTHAIGLNDVCDGLRLHSGPLSAIRGATPPSRNGLSTANRERPAALAEQLFWKTLAQLQSVSPAFGTGRAGKRLAHRFKTAIHVVDATTLQLVASCLDWAKHRRRKAAAKCHLRLDLHSFVRLWTCVRAALWLKLDGVALLKSYGPAGGDFRLLASLFASQRGELLHGQAAGSDQAPQGAPGDFPMIGNG